MHEERKKSHWEWGQIYNRFLVWYGFLLVKNLKNHVYYFVGAVVIMRMKLVILWSRSFLFSPLFSINKNAYLYFTIKHIGFLNNFKVNSYTLLWTVSCFSSDVVWVLSYFLSFEFCFSFCGTQCFDGSLEFFIKHTEWLENIYF